VADYFDRLGLQMERLPRMAQADAEQAIEELAA
jgi:tRNA-dihydrouridine synthase B